MAEVSLSERLDALSEEWYQRQLFLARDFVRRKRPWYSRWFFYFVRPSELVHTRETIKLAYVAGAVDALSIRAGEEPFSFTVGGEWE